MGLLKMENAYKFPNLRCRAWACKTNGPSNTALRGFGFPQVGLITESCITEVAARCGLAPEKVRLNQSLTHKTSGSRAGRTPGGSFRLRNLDPEGLNGVPGVSQLTSEDRARTPKFSEPCLTWALCPESWRQRILKRELRTPAHLVRSLRRLVM